MPTDFVELERGAQFAYAVFLLIGLACPFLGRIKGIKQIQFGYPWAFVPLAEISVIISFLAIHYYRNWLHFLPAWWWWFLGAVVLFLLLVLLAVHYQARLIPKRVMLLAILCYALMSGSLTVGFTHFSSTTMVYRMLYGTVLRSEGTEPAPDIPVYVLGVQPGQVIQSKTNGRGVFQFLLTKQRAQDVYEIRAMENQQLNGNWAAIDWNRQSPYHVDLTLQE